MARSFSTLARKQIGSTPTTLVYNRPKVNRYKIACEKSRIQALHGFLPSVLSRVLLSNTAVDFMKDFDSRVTTYKGHEEERNRNVRKEEKRIM